MIWAAIRGGGHTETYWINKDTESAQGGYSSCSYLQIIKYHLPTIWKPGKEFMTMLLFIRLIPLKVGSIRTVLLLLSSPTLARFEPYWEYLG